MENKVKRMTQKMLKRIENMLDIERDLLRMVLPSMFSICLCIICLVGSTFAWFTASVSTSTVSIRAANYVVETSVTVSKDATDAVVTVEDKLNNRYQLTPGTYEVNIKPAGTASTGYCVVKLEHDSQSSQTEAVRYYTEAIPKSVEESGYTFSLTIHEPAKMRILPCWGPLAEDTTDHPIPKEGISFGTKVEETVEEEPEALNITVPEKRVSISILGDGISSWKGLTDTGKANDTISSDYVAAYGAAEENEDALLKLDSVEATWWMQTIEQCEMDLLVNNSWDGMGVLGGEDAGYLTRCENLHDNTTEDNEGNEELTPDIVAVYMGTEDYLQDVEVGTFDDSLPFIQEDENGKYTYEEPATFAEAYTIMMHKMKQAYPEAEIYCFNLIPMTASTDKERMEEMNAVIRQIAEHLELSVVDLYETSGITWDNAAEYMLEGGKYPNEAGMEAISKAFQSVLEKSEE